MTTSTATLTLNWNRNPETKAWESDCGTYTCSPRGGRFDLQVNGSVVKTRLSLTAAKELAQKIESGLIYQTEEGEWVEIDPATVSEPTPVEEAPVVESIPEPIVEEVSEPAPVVEITPEPEPVEESVSEPVQTPEVSVSLPEGSRYVTFSYDIPSDSDFPNPSAYLKRIGVRFQYSCWIVKTTRLPYELMEEMKAADITYDVFAFDTREEEKIKQKVRQALAEETARIHASLLECMEEAQLRYDEAYQALSDNTHSTVTDYLGIQMARETRQKLTLKRAGEALNSAIECAELFDERGSVDHLLEGLRLVIASATASYNVLVDTRTAAYPDSKKHGQPNRVPTGPQVSWEGHSMTRLLRWMGAKGWTYEQACNVMVALGMKAAEATVRSQLVGGRNGTRGELPTLTQDQIDTLNRLK